MIRFNIDTNSKAAVYRQLVDAVTEAVRKGSLKAGELVPSMNALADELRISKETVKRAYNILSKNGILEAKQGKGFYVADDSTKDSVSVLFLMDKFSIYKQEIVHGFHQVLTVKSEDTILLFNQDITLFEYFINENLGRYDYYIVSPHFSLDPNTQEKAIKIIKRIPNQKLIMVDRLMPGMIGNFGAAYQDFENDVAAGLEQGLRKLKTIGKLNVITLPTSLYGSLIQRKISEFCQENGIKVEFMSCAPEKVRKGDAFLVLTSQLDPGLISLVDNAKGMTVGTDYYIISYNDSPIDRVVLNGLTTISTDFNEMGREIARMVNAKTLWKKHIDFKMNKRNTF